MYGENINNPVINLTSHKHPTQKSSDLRLLNDSPKWQNCQHTNSSLRVIWPQACTTKQIASIIWIVGGVWWVSMIRQPLSCHSGMLWKQGQWACVQTVCDSHSQHTGYISFQENAHTQTWAIYTTNIYGSTWYCTALAAIPSAAKCTDLASAVMQYVHDIRQ